MSLKYRIISTGPKLCLEELLILHVALDVAFN